MRRRNKDVVELLLQDSDIGVNAKTQVGMTPLHLVCMNGDLDICGVLLRHGADIRVKTADNSTPLHTAVFSCNTQLAELLIKEGQFRVFVVVFCTTLLFEWINVPHSFSEGRRGWNIIPKLKIVP